jgi:hypothetical protein
MLCASGDSDPRLADKPGERRIAERIAAAPRHIVSSGLHFIPFTIRSVLICKGNIGGVTGYDRRIVRWRLRDDGIQWRDFA